MCKTRFVESRVIAVLKSVEARWTVAKREYLRPRTTTKNNVWRYESL